MTTFGTTTSILSTKFVKLTFEYLGLKAAICSGSNPYYMPAESTCYDVCPTNYIGNDILNLCELSVPCSDPNCQTCTDPAVCEQCLPGYTPGEGGCELVVCSDPNCQTCPDPAVCNLCLPSYTVSGGSCVASSSNPCGNYIVEGS